MIVDGLIPAVNLLLSISVTQGNSCSPRRTRKRKSITGKSLHASDGTYTNGIIGVLKAVVPLLKKQQPAYVAFVFDKTRDTFAGELYP